MKLSYYPGCSLHGTSREYDLSTRGVMEALGVELAELSDWSCCGASSGHSLNETLSVGLPARNLKIAEEVGLDLAVPCAAYYNRLKLADHEIREKEEVRRRMGEALDYNPGEGVAILNPVEVVRDRVGLEILREKVARPLEGLKVACYYGCLLVRPDTVMKFDDPENPTSLDDVMEAVGATSLDWSYKTECCGGSLALTRDDVVESLVGGIVRMAAEAGADVIVTACPLCLENLEMRQGEEGLPVLYFTELLGLALGLEESGKWLNKHLTDSRPVLGSLRLLA